DVLLHRQVADPAAADRAARVGQPEAGAEDAGPPRRSGGRRQGRQSDRDDHALAHAQARGARIPWPRNPRVRLAAGPLAARRSALARLDRGGPRVKRFLALLAVAMVLFPATAYAQTVAPGAESAVS